MTDLATFQAELASDFAAFTAYKQTRLGYQVMEQSLVMADFLQGPGRRKAIMGPRLWSIKTTLCRWYIGWRWLRNKRLKIIVVSNTDDNSKAMTGAVHDDLKNDPVLRHLAPNTGKIGEYQFNVRGYRPEKGKSIRCAGLTSTLTSDRGHLIIVDDTESDKLPETRYEIVIANFSEVEALLFEPAQMCPGHDEIPVQEETQFLIVGQPHWEGSAYVVPDPDPITGEKADHPLNNVEFLWLPAMVNPETGEPDDGPHGISNFPEIVSTEGCRRKKNSLGRSKWRLEYMLSVDSADATRAVISMSALVDRCGVPDVMQAVIDPADGGECEWGVAAGGMLDHRVHVRDIFGCREEEFQNLADSEEMEVIELLWDHIFERLVEIGVQLVWLEQELVSAKRSCERYLSAHDLPIEVQTFTVRGTKLKRIVSIVELPTKTGMVSMEPHILTDQETFRQFSRLRSKKLPTPCDRLDAFASLLSILMEGPELAVAADDQKREMPGGQPARKTQAPVKLKSRFQVRPFQERMPEKTRRRLAGRR